MPPEVFVFAGPEDIAGLFGPSLCLLSAACPWLEGVTVVTPAAEEAASVLQRLGQSLDFRCRVLADDEVAPEASRLPGWFRQQYLKLNCDRVASNDALVCMGADTLVLEPIKPEDLFVGTIPILRYFVGRGKHLEFERGRVSHLASSLRVPAKRTADLADFICDFFPMSAAALASLRRFVASRRADGLLGWLDSLGPRRGWDDRFGEWALYSLFVLDVAQFPIVLRNGAAERWAQQIHSATDMASPDRYGYRIVHVAKKDLASAVLADLAALGFRPCVSL